MCGLCVQAIRQTVLRLGCTDYGEEFSGSLPDIEIEQQESRCLHGFLRISRFRKEENCAKDG